MKKLSLYCILALLCASLIFAQSTSTYVAPGGTWIWPLGADENGQPVGEVVIRPGNNVENPVHGNVFWNADYYISAEEGTPIYAPVDGTVRSVAIYNIILPDNKGSHGNESTRSIEEVVENLAEKRKQTGNPIYSLENISKDLGIKLNNGGTLWLSGFLDINVTEGQKVTKGQQIGTLGYNPTFYNDPSIKFSLNFNAGGKELGLNLLGEDNSQFFASMKTIPPYRPEKVLTKEEFAEDWNIFKIALLEDHPALIDPLIATKVQEKIAEIDIRLNDMETVRAHDFYLFAKEVLAAAHCLHTSLTKIAPEYDARNPLKLMVYEERCFVFWDWRGNNEIPTGTEIFAVNGIPINELAQELESFFSHDSMNPEVAQRQLEDSWNSPLYSLNSYFLNDTYSFTLANNEILDLSSLYREETVDWRSSHAEFLLPSPSRYEQIDEDTSVLRVEVSMDKLKDREPWIAYFKELSESSAKNLILDLRGNGGGAEADTAFLLSYFLDQPFQLAEYTEIKHGGVYKSMSSSPDEKFPAMLAKFQTPTDGAYKSMKEDFFEPAKAYGFKGNIYVLVDTQSASNAVNVARILADNGAITIGNETSGGYYSTNAETYTDIFLEQTGLKLTMPLPRVVFTTDESSGNPPNRGLIPQHIVYNKEIGEIQAEGKDNQLDYTVAQILDLYNANDTQFEYTLELIKDIELVKTQELQKAYEQERRLRISIIGLALVLPAGIPVTVLLIKKRRKAVK